MSDKNHETLAIDPQDANDNKVMAILSYLIFLVPLITGDYKKSPFVKFHLNQALVNAICVVVCIIPITILTVILALINPVLSLIGTLLLLAACGVFVVIEIICIIGAAKGEAKKAPLIGGLFTIFK